MKRRGFFKTSATAASLFAIPAAAVPEQLPSLPDPALRARNPEAYWQRVREEQFLLPGWRAFLNTGSLGIVPKPVLKAVSDYLASAAALEMDSYPRWGYETMDEFRQELADFYGCKKDELALMHNATEAMSTIAAGLDLKPGDEVLLTDQEHASGRGCWYMRAARQGIQVREVKLPLPPKSPEDIADRILGSVSKRTRVISFSGITTTTGLILPFRQICDAARAKGIISVLDGAHMHGQIPFRISELNCDFMAGSPHKWAFAPAGCGLLYVREENLDRLWPTVVSGMWDKKELKAVRFMNLGTNNRAILEGMMAGLKFLKDLGPDHVYKRIHELARYARDKAAACPHVDLLTPDDDRMYGGLVAMQFKHDNLERFEQLLKRRRIWALTGKRVRLSTHIHTRREDIDLYFETLRETLG